MCLLICQRRHCVASARVRVSVSVNRSPSRFARLPNGAAVIFRRKSVATFPAAFSSTATTAALIAATVTTAAAISAARRSAAFASGPRLVHFQLAPANRAPIQTRNCLRGFFIVRHFHERESPRPSCFAIHRHVNARHCPERLEKRPQLAFGRLKIHVAHEQTLHPNAPGPPECTIAHLWLSTRLSQVHRGLAVDVERGDTGFLADYFAILPRRTVTDAAGSVNFVVAVAFTLERAAGPSGSACPPFGVGCH
jgi:hypothetical protein